MGLCLDVRGVLRHTRQMPRGEEAEIGAMAPQSGIPQVSAPQNLAGGLEQILAQKEPTCPHPGPRRVAPRTVKRDISVVDATSSAGPGYSRPRKPVQYPSLKFRHFYRFHWGKYFKNHRIFWVKF